jgi:hypothetical protein
MGSHAPPAQFPVMQPPNGQSLLGSAAGAFTQPPAPSQTWQAAVQPFPCWLRATRAQFPEPLQSTAWQVPLGQKLLGSCPEGTIWQLPDPLHTPVFVQPAGAQSE